MTKPDDGAPVVELRHHVGITSRAPDDVEEAAGGERLHHPPRRGVAGVVDDEGAGVAHVGRDRVAEHQQLHHRATKRMRYSCGSRKICRSSLRSISASRLGLNPDAALTPAPS
jgi:hypothetical protein